MAAVVGILQFTLLIRGSHTLKDKRRVVRSIKDRLGHRFNISIAEVGANDIRNQAIMALSLVGNENGYVEKTLRKVLDQLRVHSEAELVDHSLELL